jgi:hypothetical protein
MITNLCLAQHELIGDTVSLRGYVIIQLKKKEVTEKRSNEKNHKYPIDYFFRPFFLPFMGADFDKEIDSINIFNPNYIVFLPSQLRKGLIDRFCANDTDLFKKNFSLKDAMLPPLFEISGETDRSNLYKYYFIECKAVRLELENTYDNTFYLNIPYRKQYKVLDCYFVYDTVILQAISMINSKKIKRFEW